MSQVKRVLVHDTKAITAGAVLTFNIPSFDTIDDILLTFKNSGAAATDSNIRAAIGKVALNVNGEMIINTPLSTILDFYKYMGNEVWQTNPANVIGLFVANRIFKNPIYEKLFALGCQRIQTIQLQVYCNSSVTGVTDLEISTVRRSFVSDTISLIKIVNYPQNMASTGISTVDTLPRDTNDGYLAVMTSNGGGVISEGEAIVNSDSIFNPISTNTAGYIGAARGRQPQSGYFVYDFCDGSESGLLPMNGVTDLRFKTTFTTAPTNGTYNMVAVTIKNIPALLLNAVTA